MVCKQPLKRVLIVKTSSLGDIIQAFGALDYLHIRYPEAKIDWVVEEGCKSLIETHPYVSRVICCDTKSWRKGFFKKEEILKMRSFFRLLREYEYDLLFDLQGNTKSAIWTMTARAKVKVGFGSKSVREWPNLLATNLHLNVSKELNIRLQHIALLKKHFQDEHSFEPHKVQLKISHQEEEKLQTLISHTLFLKRKKVMVCPGSKWKNKQLDPNELKKFILLLSKQYEEFAFLLFWGNRTEKALCEDIQRELVHKAIIIDFLSVPLWQNLMNKADLVIAVDSSALHLAGISAAPSFSFFGPTMPEVFKPVGPEHFAIRGECPYQKSFEKQCPLLRTCSTGACIRNLKAQDLFNAFSKWWESLS